MSDPPIDGPRIASPELPEAIPQGASLWDMALSGSGRAAEFTATGARSSSAGGMHRRGAAAERQARQRRTRNRNIVIVILALVLIIGLGDALLGSKGSAAQQVGKTKGTSSRSSNTTMPSGAPRCLATPANPTPARATHDAIDVFDAPASAAVAVVLQYPGGLSTSLSGTTDTSGRVTVAFPVASVPAGSTVDVSVDVGGASCTTSLTVGP